MTPPSLAEHVTETRPEPPALHHGLVTPEVVATYA
jgi:hypothetical protein